VVNSQTNNSQTVNGKYSAAILMQTLSDNQPTTTVFLGGPVIITIDGARSDTTVESGATLNGSGIVANLLANQGSIVAPGHSPGCLTTSNFTLNGTYQAQIGGTDPCTGYDQLKVIGTVDLGTSPNNGTLETSLYGGFVPKVGQSYIIINNDAADAVTGTFTGLAEGALFTKDGVTYKITYKGGDGNDVVLTVTSVDATKLPKTPNTGFKLVSAHPLMTLGTTVTAALALLIAARKFKAAK
jgi:fibronectin-binding autotransporter adhesin